MANKEKMDYLLLDIRELEKTVAGMRDAEIYPVSFFSQTFDLTHKILTDLHVLEVEQIERLRKQMEEHQSLIEAIPGSATIPHPVLPGQPVGDVETNVPVAEPPASAVKAQERPAAAEKQSVLLHDLLGKRNLSDFRKAFSLNDRFYFRRELFGGDEDKMNKAIADLNDIHSYEESIDYLNKRLQWNIEDVTVADFVRLLEKRFL
jgi:hypothetical protein